MGEWKAIALRTVDQQSISRALSIRGLDWNQCTHVPATLSLANALRTEGTLAIAIFNIIDVIVLSGLTGNDAISIDRFPGRPIWGDGSDIDRQAYQDAENVWSQEIRSKRIWFGMAHQQHLRDFLRDRGLSNKIRQVLLKSSWDFARTMQELIAAGVYPATLAPDDEVAKAAKNAWVDLEEKYPFFTAVRDDLWISPDEFRKSSSDRAISLKKRIQSTLSHLFGRTEDRRTIIWHGFHFFTPPQFALFKLLSNLPDIDQYFIVHDDGRSAVFETWRRFFVERWGMPKPERESFYEGYTSPAKAFRDALHGEPIDSTSLSGSLQIKRFRTVTEFAREWISDRSKARDDKDARPRFFAASAEEASRFVERFGTMVTPGTTKLSLLPIGSFLYQVHACITIQGHNEISIQLSQESVVDIATSGFLTTERHGTVGLEVTRLLRMALPYFRNCTTADDWVEKAQSLQTLIGTKLSQYSPRSSQHTDVERINAASSNLLRLAPWADLSPNEVDLVVDIIQSLARLIQTIVERDRLSLRDHLDFLKARLLLSMHRLPQVEREELEKTINDLRAAEDLEVSVDGLRDFVQLLLGVQADFSVTGDQEASQQPFAELRNLDALGFKRLRSELHVANLSDVTFPSKGGTVGWPFRIEDLQFEDCNIPPASLEIIQTRSEAAGLSDLYLLFLALNGVQEKTITLSYIEKMGGDIRNPSSMLALLSEISGRVSPALRKRTGGIAVTPVISPADSPPIMVRRNPIPPNIISLETKASAMGKLNPIAIASAEYCPRRFVIQWAMGPSAAFQSEHHHLMLYGNLLSALVRASHMSDQEARKICDQLWQHFTDGQLKSSEEKAAIGLFKGARAEWVFTLSGSHQGDNPSSRAYKAAQQAADSLDVKYDVLSPKTDTFLPAAHMYEESNVCTNCPVQPRCAVWKIS